MSYKPIKSKNHKFIYEVEFPLKFVIDRIKRGNKMLKHNNITYNTSRLQRYLTTGFVCKYCGIEGTHCIGGMTRKGNQHHVDFYGVNHHVNIRLKLSHG